MKTGIVFWRCALLAAGIAGAATLGGCSVNGPKVEALARYDFGLPAQPLPAGRTLPPLTLFDVQAGPGVDSPVIAFRLLYADPLQLRPYSRSRWAEPPARLIELRLRQKLGNITTVLTTGDTALAPVLRVTVEEFSHVFDSAAASRGLVRLSATVLVNRKVVGGTTIERSVPAPSGDAVGGVRALTEAADAALDGLAHWLQSLPADRLATLEPERTAR